MCAQTKLQTFTSPDGVFQFKYSPALVHCTRGRTKAGDPGSWLQAECSSQDPVCDDDASSGATIVCFAYPKDKFKNKPAFDASAFFVAEVPAAATPKACLEGSQDWLVGDSQAAAINGIKSKVFHTSDAWLGGGIDGEIYRVFHANKCYEIGIQDATSSTGSYDPGTFEEFTEHDAVEVRARLQEPLDSFTFLK
ncbi:MAG: hypothetical protein WA192_09285 [Candidatus Acidiferrales bacterium]